MIERVGSQASECRTERSDSLNPLGLRSGRSESSASQPRASRVIPPNPTRPARSHYWLYVGFPDILGETGKCSDDRRRVVLPVSPPNQQYSEFNGRKVKERLLSIYECYRRLNICNRKRTSYYNLSKGYRPPS